MIIKVGHHAPGDHQLPAEDWDPGDQDHRQGDGEGLCGNVSYLKTILAMSVDESIQSDKFFKWIGLQKGLFIFNEPKCKWHV